MKRKKQRGFLLNPFRFSASGPQENDPHWKNVAALLHFNGDDQSQVFTDQTGKIWTPSGNAKIAASQFKFGNASGSFQASNSSAISTPAHADFGFGTGDFTVECWVRRSNSNCVVWDARTSGADSSSLVTFFDPSGYICFFDSSTKTGSLAVPVDAWTHTAWCRATGVMRMFVGGAMAYSSPFTNNIAASRPMRVGLDIVGGAAYSGFIDDLRVTKGVARYTSNFTPPSAAFPNF